MFAKRGWAAALIAAALVVSSGCGGSAETNQGQQAASTSAAKQAEGNNAAKTRTVKTEKGEVTIPTEPKRVVAAYYHGTLAALGINAIGANKEWWMGSPFLKQQEAKMEDIGAPGSLEKVASLNPDMIVINGHSEENYDKFSKIAPTVFIPYTAYKNVREEVKLLGDMLGRQKEAADWLAKYEQKAKESREKVKGVVKEGETAIIINVREKKISLLGDNYGRGGEVIYNMMKFKVPEFVQKEAIDSGKQIVEISMETLPTYANVDRIFICMNDGTTEEQVKAILDSAIWKSLPAVKNNKVYMLDYKTYLYYDPISILGQADLIADMLVKGAK
ncbi:MAG: hypothetical protein K0Q59_5250 [Paenibacillus sp.]|jgi:iron complex transport system substrate-binding protein|nr:hypothetical protein [Paenibacillus sp.]